jgi:hypothetical protein
MPTLRRYHAGYDTKLNGHLYFLFAERRDTTSCFAGMALESGMRFLLSTGMATSGFSRIRSSHAGNSFGFSRIGGFNVVGKARPLAPSFNTWSVGRFLGERWK